MSTAQATTPVDAAEPSRGPRAGRGPRLWVPLTLVLLATGVWAMVLNNGIFIDESVYIRSGRAYIEHWTNGTPLPDWVGEGFSGLPMLYPVLAAGLDMVGGLALVRGFSLLCVVATMLLLRSIAAQIFNRRTGLVTAAMFAFTGPVLYVSHLGTFDALVILMLVAVWRLGMSDSWWVVFAIVPLLALAVATKYTAYAFVPTLLVLSCFRTYSLTHSTTFRQWLRPRLPWQRILRAVAIGLITASLLTWAYQFADDTTRRALAFTTTNRSALSPTPREQLLVGIPDFMWPILLAAVLGLIWLARAKRWTALLWGVGLFGTALLLPVGQIILSEGVSYQKHMAYSAAFLAPLAGWGFARPWKLAIWTPVLIWWLVLVSVWGAFRSHDLIQYPDVRPVAETIDFRDGTYLSSSADSLSYFTRENPDIDWRTTFALYAQGNQEIQRAVDEKYYSAIIVHDGPTGSSIQDEGQEVLIDALRDSEYDLQRVGEHKEWLVYTP